MVIATVVLSLLLAAAMAWSAVRKLGHAPDVVASYARLGVPESRLDLLACILLAGSVGLVAGIVWPVVGIAASTAIACYFGVAIAFHLRAKDAVHVGVPLVLTTMALAALVLRVLSR